MKWPDMIIGDRIRIVGIMGKEFKGVAIPAIQAIRGAEPHKAVAILQNADNAIIWQSVFSG